MKSFAEKSREAYNRKADDYDNTFDGHFTKRYQELLLAEMAVNPDDSILDVGCGNGTLFKMLSEKYPINGHGVDISEKMIENARKKCPRMTFKVSSCDRIPFPDQIFDIITVCVALHHFPDIRAFAAEAARLLKPGGLLYIAEGHLPLIIRQMFNPFVRLSKSGDVKVYSPKEIERAFASFGFQMIRIKRRGVYQMLIEMRKR